MTLPVILVASLLPEQGYCGVQTHFRAVMAFARDQGHEVRLVHPHQRSLWVRLLPSLVTRVLRRIDTESAILWHRAVALRFLCARLRQNLRQLAGRPVVIYAQDPLSARAALRMRAEGFDFRLVAVLHFNISEAHEHQVNGLTSEGGPLWRALMRNEQTVLPRLDKVIFVSEYMRQVVLARNPTMATVPREVISNFPERSTAVAGQPRQWHADIISIGTLEPRKNQGYLLHVLAAANRLGRTYRLTLVGDGPSRGEWEALARQLGVAAQVEFLGYVSGAAHLLPAHRAYAHAAHMESFGIVLVEAMSYGLPLFAAPVGGIPEVFDNGVEGILWPLDNAALCAEKLIAVLDDQSTWRRLSQAATLRYQTRFAPAVLGPKWINAIVSDQPVLEPALVTPSTMKMATA